MWKPFPIGVDSFEEMRTKGYYYVDKTGMIGELLMQKGKVNLFTRPRRFGKTLNLSMLRYFFEYEDTAERQASNKELFQGLWIMEQKGLCEVYMGQYPVINLSLKSAKQPDFDMSYYSMADEIGKEFLRHQQVLKSSKLSVGEKRRFERIMNWEAEQIAYAKSLAFLSECLSKVYDRKVIILLDEYDVPLENAYFKGFYEEMIDFIRSLFESAFKTNEALEFAVITGCLRVSGESVFTGLNNLNVISIRKRNYSEHFGFTQSEVEKMLDFYGLGDRGEEAQRWYDGYLFGSTEVYNPWSIVNYAEHIFGDIHAFPEPYWSNTSSNGAVYDLVKMADDRTKKEIEDLMEGGVIEKEVHEDITYADIHKSQENLWNFLFFTGYLKKVSERQEGDKIYLTLAIPNTEVRYIYRNTILSWFEEQVRQKDFTRFYQALLEQQISVIEEEISENLMETISFFDYGESYYHGFLAGLLKNLAKYYVESNREQGNGRPDLVIRSAPYRGIAIIIELKVANSFGEMERKAENALQQIRDMQYQKGLEAEGYHTFICYGISFYRKSCCVKI